MKKITQLFSAVALTVISFSAVAEETVHFIPLVAGRQYFECTASDVTAQVKMDTSSVDAEGFCPGHGHMTIDANTVNKSYFVVDNAGAHPEMNVNINVGTITCKNLTGPDSGRQEYGKGQGFCALPPG